MRQALIGQQDERADFGAAARQGSRSVTATTIKVWRQAAQKLHKEQERFRFAVITHHEGSSCDLIHRLRIPDLRT
jgi:hypothetical protein